MICSYIATGLYLIPVITMACYFLAMRVHMTTLYGHKATNPTIIANTDLLDDHISVVLIHKLT